MRRQTLSSFMAIIMSGLCALIALYLLGQIIFAFQHVDDLLSSIFGIIMGISWSIIMMEKAIRSKKMFDIPS